MARGDMRGPSGFNRLLRVRGGSIVAAARMRAVTLKRSRLCGGGGLRSRRRVSVYGREGAAASSLRRYGPSSSATILSSGGHGGRS